MVKKKGYRKKNIKKKTKKSKNRKNNKMISKTLTSTVPLIEESDIMYQDDLVCILNPNSKKGIIVWTGFEQPENMESLCNLGLKTGKRLHEEGINFGRSKIHPYIFFRAPYYSGKIDYSTVETEIISLYGKDLSRNKKAFIRVDPDKTFVFSSEIRDNNPHDIEKSKKLLSDYLKIINNNAEIYKTLLPFSKTHKQAAYNLFSSNLIPVKYNEKKYTQLKYPLNNYPIERNSEILVSTPHLTQDYFVLCET